MCKPDPIVEVEVGLTLSLPEITRDLMDIVSTSRASWKNTRFMLMSRAFTAIPSSKMIFQICRTGEQHSVDPEHVNPTEDTTMTLKRQFFF